MLTKTELILTSLIHAGSYGVHGFDLLNIGGYRYAARIYDLRKKGFAINSIPERRGKAMGVRYCLNGMPEKKQ